MIKEFNFASIPHIIFGAGKLIELNDIIPQFGNEVLFIIGGSSLKNSGNWEKIQDQMMENSINYSSESIQTEPSPSIVDHIAGKYRKKRVDVVIGIGGGSVTDAAKAISAMIPKKDSIKNYLEGVGTKIHDGQKIPYIAIPTTSGTGSEATKNAVISQIGPNGFKKSLRHDNLIPNYAIIDPELMVSCPPSVTSSCGLDAFTQLLEAYTSNKANPMTDALAFSGMNAMKDSIILASTTGAANVEIRSSMAYGSLMSGITLANAGLGIIHGLASPIGGYFHIPHGVVCGTLLAESTKMNVNKLIEQGSSGLPYLKKFGLIGALFEGKMTIENSQAEEYALTLIKILEMWTEELSIARLGNYGINEKDAYKIVEKSGLKNNPAALKKEDIETIVLNRL